jgi:hypothetical protein
MTNGIISQPSAFGFDGKGGFGNPFVVSSATVTLNDEWLLILFSSFFSTLHSRRVVQQMPTTRFYET